MSFFPPQYSTHMHGMSYHCSDMSVYREQEDDMTWTPVCNSIGYSTTLNETMARLSQEEWSWRMSSPSSLLLPSEQAFCITDPVSRISEGESAGVDSYYTSHGSGIPITTAQWPTGHYPHEQYAQVTDGQPYHQDRLYTYQNAASTLQSTPLSDKRIPLPDVFASIKGPQYTPPDATGDAQPQRKNKRSTDDLYTPQWVRHSGAQREGWCGWCSTWFTLRDSTYWYHMHYSHGISQVDGKRLPAPAGFKVTEQANEWEVKCGKCTRWMPLPQGERWNTAYFRHTYKCYFKAGGKVEQCTSSSPSMLKPSMEAILPLRRV